MILTVALLGGAALLIRTARNLDAVRAGYETENVLAMTVTTVNATKWKEFHAGARPRRHRAWRQIRRVRLGTAAHRQQVAVPDDVPGEPGSPAVADKAEVPLRAITQDYFKVMGMSLVDGRELRLSDDNQAPRVIIVNEALVRQYFRGEQALGRRIFFTGDAKTRTSPRNRRHRQGHADRSAERASRT